MKRTLFLTLSAVVISTLAVAQEASPRRSFYEVDAAAGAGKELFIGALGGTRWHSLGAKGKLQLGYGLRITGAFGGAQDFITAPADLTRENSGFLVALFSKQRKENLDTLTVPGSTILMVNAAVHIRYEVLPRLRVGFYIDVIGVSFGSVDNGVFTAGSLGRVPSAEASSPSSFNLLLIGDNDRGSLSSEFYVSYEINEQWAVRAGLNHFFTEVTTDRKLTLDNDRFRNISDLGFIGVNYRF